MSLSVLISTVAFPLNSQSAGRPLEPGMCRPLNLSVIMLALSLGGKSERLFLDVERNISLKGGRRRGSRPRLAAQMR